MKRLVAIGFIKLYTGFAIVISVTLANFLYDYFSAQQNKQRVHEINMELRPYMAKLEDFRLLLTQSKMYATNWVFLQYEVNPDRDKLIKLQEKDYPQLKKELLPYLSYKNSRQDKDTVLHLLKKFEELIGVEKEIMSNLSTFDQYQEASNRFMAEDLVESEILPRSKDLIGSLDNLIDRNRTKTAALTQQMEHSFSNMLALIIGMSVLIFLVVLLLMIYIHRSITTPVLNVKDNLSDLSIGKLPETTIAASEDVIGDMVKAVVELNESFNKTSMFAQEIGKGNLNATFTPLSSHDRLGNALIEMRESLRAYAYEMEQKVAERTLEISRQKEQLAIEKKKSDDLLLNILPSEIAEELKAQGWSRARSFRNVSVMFADIKNFTKLAEKMTPEELVAEIDFYFRSFDAVIGKYGLEKIKTIGDAYMCASGLPVKDEDNAYKMVKACMDIMEFIQDTKREKEAAGKECFDLRIGIHCGPLVAGIVGMKKFAYDIWGDTVNVAARMEQSGEAGKVNISNDVYERIKDRFVCTYRGKVEAKNKGEIDMYFVEQEIGVEAPVEITA